MAQLLVRGIDEDLVRELKLRAARNGNSAEEEHRRILRKVLGMTESPRSLKDLLSDMPDAGEDRDFERPADRGRLVNL
jgi:plasmid stability protein